MILRNTLFYWPAFWNLLKIDILLATRTLWMAIFDEFIWISMSVFANGYILPVLGTSQGYGALIAMGAVVSCAVFGIYNASVALVSDFTGERVISYELMLPLPAWMVLLKMSLSRAVRLIIITILVVPLSKLILMDRLDLSNFVVWKFILALIIICSFAGAALPYVSSIPKDLFAIEQSWTRYIFPLWFMGGTIFPYPATKAAFPLLGKLLLLNPIIYTTEIIRAATLSPENYVIPFGVSALVLTLFSAGIFYLGYKKLQDRLDFI